MEKISDAELKVMQIIWDKKETTSKEIIKELEGENWTDNTTRTLITRLLEKKAIGISKKVGKSYFYIPLYDEEKYKIFMTKKFINLLYDGSFSDFILCFLQNSSKNIEEVKELIKTLIDSSKK